MQKHLIQNAAQHIAIAFCPDSNFNCLGDSGAQASVFTIRMISQDLTADIGRIRRGWCYRRTVSAHHFTPVGFLLIGNADHKDLTFKSQIATCHRERCAPLAGSRLSRHALKALVLRVVGLRDGGIELVAAACVITLELIVNMRRCAERLLQTVGAHKR